MKFIGLANKPEPLETKEGFLKEAVNVDVDNLNNVRMRDGYSVAKVYGAITASYTLRDLSDAFIIADQTLIRLSDDKIIAQGMGAGSYIFDDFEGNLFIYGERTLIVSGTRLGSLNIPVCPQPTVTVVNGTQPHGIYQVTATYVDGQGKQGGTSSVVIVNMENTNALSIEVEQLAGYSVNIYISPPNGEYTYLWKNTTDSLNIWTSNVNRLVYPLQPEFIATEGIISGGTNIAYHDSRLFVAEYLLTEHKTVVWFSQAHTYHLFNRDSDYFIIEGEVTNIIDNENTLVITTAKAIYYYENGNVNKVAQYGVPKGSPFDRNKDGMLWVYTHRGICQLNPFKNLTEEVYNFPISSIVNSAVVESNGFERIINLLNDSESAPNTFQE